MVDTPVLGTGAARHGGSSPLSRTKLKTNFKEDFMHSNWGSPPEDWSPELKADWYKAEVLIRRTTPEDMDLVFGAFTPFSDDTELFSYIDKGRRYKASIPDCETKADFMRKMIARGETADEARRIVHALNCQAVAESALMMLLDDTVVEIERSPAYIDHEWSRFNGPEV